MRGAGHRGKRSDFFGQSTLPAFDEGELLAILNRHLSHSQIAVQLEEQKEQAHARLAHLTEREREVFNGLAMGKTNKVHAHQHRGLFSSGIPTGMRLVPRRQF